MDPDGRMVVHHRTVDSLGKMLRAGTIIAGDARRRTGVPERLRHRQPGSDSCDADPGVSGVGREPELTDRQLDARRRVHAALQALGGINSPAGSCVWHVVGLQRSVREWAIRRSWSGRPVRQEQAQGILIAGLGVLVAHVGRSEAKQAS